MWTILFTVSVHCAFVSLGWVNTIPAEWQARQLLLTASAPGPSGKIRSEVGISIDCEVKRIGSGAGAASATRGDSMSATLRAAERIGVMAVLLKRPGRTRSRYRSA